MNYIDINRVRSHEGHGNLSRKRWFQAVSGVLLLAASLTVSAQTWPVRPVRVVVGTAPGGGVDLMARALAQPLSDLLGQSVVIDNRAGGSGNLSAVEIIRSTPDGYNLLFGPMTQQTVNPSLIKGSPNSARDLVPVALIGRSQLHLVTKKDLQATSVADLVKLAKSKPGTITYSSSGAFPEAGRDFIDACALQRQWPRLAERACRRDRHRIHYGSGLSACPRRPA